MTEREKVKAVLETIPGIKAFETKWPDKFNTLPCIVLTLASERGVDRRDDEEYLTEIEWYVRTFAAKEADLQAVSKAAGAAMRALGYERTLLWEQTEGNVRQVVARYQKTIPMEMQ